MKKTPATKHRKSAEMPSEYRFDYSKAKPNRFAKRLKDDEMVGFIISALYMQLLDSWNKRKADDFANLFIESGNLIGFDGSQINGRAEIASQLRQIFSDHLTASYVSKIREVRLLAPNVAILRANASMVPHGQSDLNPATNAFQTLVAVKKKDLWQIALFQNTPAQFHGRPELAQQLTEELRELL